MMTTAIDRSRWLRLAAAVAIALLAIGVGAASLAAPAGAKKASKGGKHKNGKKGGKAGVYVYKGKAGHASQVSEFKVKLNGSGVPVKIVGFTLTTVGECSGVPAEVVTEWTAPTPVKTKKVRGKPVRYFKQPLSGVGTGERTRKGSVSGTFDSNLKSIGIDTDHGYTKPLSEGYVFDCESREGLELHKAGRAGGGKGKKGKSHGGKTRGHGR